MATFMLPATLDRAIRLGVRRYFTGIPCANGHVAERIAPDGQCVECRKVIRRNNRKKRRERWEEARSQQIAEG